jgi:hypothetical protein
MYLGGGQGFYAGVFALTEQSNFIEYFLNQTLRCHAHE